MEPATPLGAPEAIARLRSRRRFAPGRPIPDDLLKRVLHLATRVPSAHNLQPWRFVVVRDGRNRRRLRRCVYDRPEAAEAPAVVIVLAFLHPHRTHLDAIVDRQGVSPEEAAKMRAMAFKEMERHPDIASWARATASRALAALAIAAESLGVASATIEEYDPAKVADAFGIPTDHVLCGLVALGYSEEDEPFPGRLALEDVCYEEHFGQPWTRGEPS